MKTILSVLLLALLVSCARRPSEYAAVPPPPPPPRTSTAAVPPAPVPPRPVVPAAATVPTAAAPPTVIVTTNRTALVVDTNAPAPAAVARVAEPNPALSAVPTPVPLDAVPEQTIAPGTIDLRNMPLEQALEIYAELVGRTLLRPAALPAQQITLRTQTPLTRSEAIQALDAVFGLNGITIVNFGDKFVKVVAEPMAGTTGAPRDQRTAAEFPVLGSYVTHVVQLKYVKPTEIVQVLMPFAKIPNSILPIDSSQILVLRDYTENVKRMLEMVKEVDVVVPAEFVSEVIPIKYAKATEISEALNSLSSGGGGATSVGRSTSGGTRPGAPGGANRGGLPGYNQPGQPLGGTTPGGGAPGAVGGAPGQNNFTANLQRIIQRASASGDLQIIGQNKIIADERSNSLLIFATRTDMETIKNIISKLDVVLAQVLIETVIMDVQLDNSWAFGVSIGQGPKVDKTSGASYGGVVNNTDNGSGSSLSTLGQFFGNSLTNFSRFPSSSGLSYFGRYKGDVDVAIAAAAARSRVDVIQRPQILTSHATPGSIFVGNTVPYVTSTYYGGGFNGGPSSSYQQLSVGIGLTVTPYINPDGLVVMQIDETIDEISGSTTIQGVGSVPNTTHRTLSAEVAVRDGDSVILGGFIRNSTDKEVSGVPILKDIPLLGALFTSRSNSKSRKELVVLMRPTVLRTPEIAALASTEERKRLPGILHAEGEVLDQEKNELMREQKIQEQRAREGKVTTDEGKSYLNRILGRPEDP